MTFQRLLRIATVSVIALGLAAIGLAGENADPVAFLEGTATDIPARTTGQLDFEDSQNLHFRFGESDLAIPYEKITGYKWGKRFSNSLGGQFSGSASKMGRTLMPMFFGKRKALTLYYENEETSKTEQVVFAMPKHMVSATDPIISAWVDRNNAIPRADLDIPSADTWWGNQYWKTNKNAHLWKKARKSPSSDEDGVEVANREE